MARSRGDGPQPAETPLKLHPADIAIIRCLHEDARSSIVKIADRLRMPESTVRHRLNRLIEDGIIEFAALTNPFRFGYQIWVMINIRVSLAHLESVTRRLAAVPEIYFVGITTGGYDVLAAAVFRSNAEVLAFITKRLAKIPGILHTSTANILSIAKRTMTFGVPNDTVNGVGAPGAGNGSPRTRRRSSAAGRAPSRRPARPPAHA